MPITVPQAMPAVFAPLLCVHGSHYIRRGGRVKRAANAPILYVLYVQYGGFFLMPDFPIWHKGSRAVFSISNVISFAP